MSATALEERLRLGDPHVITRIKDGRLLIDPRTLREDEETEIVDALAAAVREA
jgi:seryl-tRNA(Sec) selenium transferase